MGRHRTQRRISGPDPNTDSQNATPNFERWPWGPEAFIWPLSFIWSCLGWPFIQALAVAGNLGIWEIKAEGPSPPLILSRATCSAFSLEASASSAAALAFASRSACSRVLRRH